MCQNCDKVYSREGHFNTHVEKCTLIETANGGLALPGDDCDPCDVFPSFIKDVNLDPNKNLNSTLAYQSQLSDVALEEISTILGDTLVLESDGSYTNLESDVDFNNVTDTNQVDTTDSKRLDGLVTPIKCFTFVSSDPSSYASLIYH